MARTRRKPRRPLGCAVCRAGSRGARKGDSGCVRWASHSRKGKVALWRTIPSPESGSWGYFRPKMRGGGSPGTFPQAWENNDCPASLSISPAHGSGRSGDAPSSELCQRSGSKRPSQGPLLGKESWGVCHLNRFAGPGG